MPAQNFRPVGVAGCVHPLAHNAMTCIELLARYHTTLDLILTAANERGSLAGVVSDLIASMLYGAKGKNARKPGARLIRGGRIVRIFPC